MGREEAGYTAVILAYLANTHKKGKHADQLCLDLIPTHLILTDLELLQLRMQNGKGACSCIGLLNKRVGQFQVYIGIGIGL
eukprot:1149729-Pelagomonas_calceolata.AAC.3